MNAPSAETIARALGGSRCGSGWLARCPAHEDKRPSLSIRDGRNGILLNCLAGCDFRAVRDALRALDIMPPFRPGEKPPKPIPAPIGPSADDRKRTETARWLYDRASDFLEETPAALYLRSRAIWEPGRRSCLRYSRLKHPQTGEANVPAIIVPRHDTRTGAVAGVQRVFLTEDGAKYPRLPFVDVDGCTGLSDAKLALGTAPDAWAMLHEATDQIVLAEGAETALAASLLFDRPAWAKCGPFPHKIDLPEHMREVLICADHDPGGNSQRKAERLAAFILGTGRLAAVWTPEALGHDANDTLLARDAAA